ELEARRGLRRAGGRTRSRRSNTHLKAFVIRSRERSAFGSGTVRHFELETVRMPSRKGLLSFRAADEESRVADGGPPVWRCDDAGSLAALVMTRGFPHLAGGFLRTT